MRTDSGRQTKRFTAYQSSRREIAIPRESAAQSRAFRIMLAYAGATTLCLVFCAIYELFSFGEHSDAMRMMFMIPLLGGAAPFGLMAVSENPPALSRTAFNLWNSGLAVRISGCLVQGIIEISGRTCDYDNHYRVISGIFLALAFVIQLAAWRRTNTKPQVGRR